VELDEKRFNHFLDEIFRSEIVVDGERSPYIDIPDYGGPEDRPDTPVFWEAGWTVIRLPDGSGIDETNFDSLVMGGHGC
jgi:hypothetical protein